MGQPERLACAPVQSSPTNFRGTARFLRAANGGSNSITVFRNEPDGLVPVDIVKNSVLGTVTSFPVEDDGTLVQIDEDRDTSVTGSIGIAGQ